jgi:hypothetical protein
MGWHINLRCPTCGKTGRGELSQLDVGGDTRSDHVPDGFATRQRAGQVGGIDFYCIDCDELAG